MRIDKAFCDNCGEEDLHKCFPVTMSCGFGSIFDEFTFDFCSDKCCVEFIQKKMKECESGKGYLLPLREEYEKQISKIRPTIEDKMKRLAEKSSAVQIAKSEDKDELE